MTRRAAGVLWVVLVAFATWFPSFSTARVGRRQWADADAFVQGTWDGVAVDEEGHVTLAPRLRSLWGPGEGIVWDLAAGTGGTVFAALSGPGRLLRLEAGREPETWYRASGEALVTALAGDGRGGVYFAVSPEGTVRHARSKEQVETVLETKAGQVWDLATDRSGDLWVATGRPGRILRRAPGGGVETVFESGEDPIRCMAVLPGAGVLAGTGAKARVVRIGPDGKVFVLLDASEDEIVAVAAAPDGTVYALAVRGGPGRKVGVSSGIPSADEAVPKVKVETSFSPPPEKKRASGAAPKSAGGKTPGAAMGGTLYRISPAGDVRSIWTTRKRIPLSLVVDSAGLPVVGTGDDGRVVRIAPDGKAVRWVDFPSDQVTALLARSHRGGLLVGGAGDARVAALGPETAAEGRWRSRPLDAGEIADAGRVRWDGDVPTGAAVVLRLRAGNTETPDETWSKWEDSRVPAGEEGAMLPVPPARWFQVGLVLQPSPRGVSPTIRRVEFLYQPRNLPPRIRSLSVEPENVVWRLVPSQSAGRGGPYVADNPVAREAARAITPRSGHPPIRKSYEAGARTVTWKAEDPEGDPLRFDVDIRRAGESEWFPLARDLDATFLSWDTRFLPDGMYRVRLTATDTAGNPASRAGRDRKMSEPFRLDHTPPSVERLETRRAGKGNVVVTFDAVDHGGRVRAAEYALEGATWSPLLPEDGVADSTRERYRIEATAAPGTHLAVRVTDTSGNVGGALLLLP